MTFSRSVDLGAAIYKAGSDEAAFGWFTGQVRPTLAISLPRPERTAAPLQLIRIGPHDLKTCLDMDTFSVQADFAIHAMAADTELGSLFGQTGDHV